MRSAWPGTAAACSVRTLRQRKRDDYYMRQRQHTTARNHYTHEIRAHVGQLRQYTCTCTVHVTERMQLDNPGIHVGVNVRVSRSRDALMPDDDTSLHNA